jgi:hypothetical protein
MRGGSSERELAVEGRRAGLKRRRADGEKDPRFRADQGAFD